MDCYRKSLDDPLLAADAQTGAAATGQNIPTQFNQNELILFASSPNNSTGCNIKTSCHPETRKQAVGLAWHSPMNVLKSDGQIGRGQAARRYFSIWLKYALTELVLPIDKAVVIHA
jgi:hypothetical protein